MKELGLPSEDHLYNLDRWRTHWEPNVIKPLELIRKEKCESKTCNFDFSKLSFICGPLPSHGFEDGQSCLDGSTPKTKDEFKKTEAYKENKIDEEGYELKKEVIEDANKKAQEWYGKNCKSGKYYYHIYRGNYICTLVPENASSLSKPFNLLFTFLTTASILRTFLL